MKRKVSSLQKKMWILIGLLVLPLNIVSIIISTVMIQDARESILNSIDATVHTYAEAIEQKTYNTDYLLYYLENKSEDCVTMFTTKDITSYYLSKGIVANYIINYESNIDVADVFYFYRSDLEDYTLCSDNYLLYRKYLQDNYYFAETASQNAIWHLEEIDGITYLSRNLKEGEVYYGAFINLDEILEGIEEYLDYPISEILFTEEAPETGSKLVSSVWCDKAGIFLTLTFEHSVLTENIESGRLMLVGIVLSYIALIPILFLYIRRWVITPLQELNDAHRHLEMGEETWRIQSQATSSEFQSAYRSFNEMADGLQELRLENINKELAYKQMLLDNLQLQIRPHFLLNCFNSLYTMIQTGKNDGAGETILYLSQYFRYLFQYNSGLELFSKELDLIEKYIEVSEYEHPGEFTFQTQFDPEISMVRVPPLLFHNFIENIFSHALVHGRVVHILFNGFYEDGMVSFQISDDGSGLVKEDVDRINQGDYLDYQRGSHVGLRNSINRLRFFYHEKATVHVDSVLNEGTTFTIIFPYDLEVEEDEFTDGK